MKSARGFLLVVLPVVLLLLTTQPVHANGMSPVDAHIHPMEVTLEGGIGNSVSTSWYIDVWSTGLFAGGPSAPITIDVDWLRGPPDPPYPATWEGGEVWADLTGLSIGIYEGHITATGYLGGSDAVCTVHLHVVPFTDVLPSSNWAWQEISACGKHGIINGFPSGAFAPDWLVDRASVAAFVARAMVGGDEQVPPGPAEPTFRDVPPEDWVYRYVEYLAAQDVVRGYGSRSARYSPNGVVDRGHAAVYLARALAGGETHVPDGPSAPTFQDVPADYWAYRHIEYCAGHGVIYGYEDGTYRPSRNVTRAQTAALIARAFVLEF